MTNPSLRLFAYWRSSASYRARIGLALKELQYELVPVHLVEGGGQQHSPEHHARNPQELVPALEHDGRLLTQSLSILEYLDEVWPDRGVRLVRGDAADRQRIRALAQSIACEIQPLGNLRVLKALGALGASEEQRQAWVRHWTSLGLQAFEEMLASSPQGRYCFGDTPTLADCLLIPQLYNARRFDMDVAAFPRIAAIDAVCAAHPAFIAAHPDNQPDAPKNS
ncbi:maleylacetoacetate isomerase [Solilutibacter silvestris]|uniref:MaiA: maleylacetoacetate isomerase n=1 Tax=Solilutibacter silvestris TaxID=1645665 RepID=A0A2K1Q2L6_9GAMM|nr:maleylacetoacetate isomerase [Lysobacter silvestris]PNS09197.1 maiA: maleylacetoacetate isomerase [Lysobacter silvestris]